MKRIRRDLARLGLPPLQITSKAKTERGYMADVALIDGLIDDAQIGVLKALGERRVTLAQLTEAKRQNELRGSGVLASIAKRENLWDAIEAALPRMGKAKATRDRYAQTFRMLKRKAAKYLPTNPTVGDLLTVDWNALREEWGNSASDWMHVRRFVSAFLTKHLDDVYHPFRRAVVSKIPTATEVSRVPDLTPEVFWQIVGKAKEHVRAAYVTIVLTGMRRAEYLRCTKASLKPAILAVQVPGSKTGGSSDTVYIEESMWPWVEAGIPSPVRYKRLRELWIEACKAAGVTDVHLHDLRHALGQWSANAGVSEAHIQQAMRHVTPSMTRRYTIQKAKGEVAGAMSKALKRGA